MVEKDSYLFFGHITEQMARDIVYLHEKDVLSIVGHQSMADLLSVRLSIVVPVNRINYVKKKDDQIIVATAQRRLEEGKVLSLDELKAIPIKFMLVK